MKIIITLSSIILIIIHHHDHNVDCWISPNESLDPKTLPSWLISLKYIETDPVTMQQRQYYACDGAIVSQKNVIIPAHCVDVDSSANQSEINPEDYIIDSPRNLKSFKISDIILNSRWNPDAFTYNFATITIDGVFNSSFKHINIELFNKTSLESMNGKKVSFLTYDQKSKKYNKQEIIINVDEDCQKHLPEDKWIDNQREICSCRSDFDDCSISNGAIAYTEYKGQTYIAGIASWITDSRLDPELSCVIFSTI